MSLKRVGILPVCSAALMLVIARVWLALVPGGAVRWSAARSDGRGRQPIPEDDLERRAPIAADPSVYSEYSVALARAVAGVGVRWPFRATCLEQGVALVMLLAIARTPARLVIGVSRRAPASTDRAALHAHAWVESDGRVLLGAAQSHGLLPLT